MSATTPGLTESHLSPTDARFVVVDELGWKATPSPGIEMKVLMRDEERGLLTALFRWQPGAVLPLHEHVDIEQTWVLAGSIVDDEGEVLAGNFSWRPAGNRHAARAPEGALVLAFFLKPNVFVGDEFTGQELV